MNKQLIFDWIHQIKCMNDFAYELKYFDTKIQIKIVPMVKTSVFIIDLLVNIIDFYIVFITWTYCKSRHAGQ